jgi:carboxyl-terminal processing protease
MRARRNDAHDANRSGLDARTPTSSRFHTPPTYTGRMTTPRSVLRRAAWTLALLAVPFAPAAPAQDAVPSPEPAKVVAPPAAPDPVPLPEIQRYVSVYRAIKDAYVEPIGDHELMRRALRGLLADLDPHSAYLEQDSAEALTEQTTGRYVGIGVELEQRPDRLLTVVAPIDGGPAAKAGILSGDVIEAIDDRPITARDLDSASRGLRGPAGSPVKLRLRREGATEPREVTLIRAQISVHAVSSRLLEPGIGYLRIASFQADSGTDVVAELSRLATLGPGPLRGLVLDLRSNPGGVLAAAVSSADAFLDGGVVVRSRGRLATSNATYSAQPGDLLAGAPIVVLIDSGTASAAEILAGALQDRGRARLVGSRSFGKGSIQSVVPLANGDAVKLTTGRYYTPNDHSIQARGLVPDVVLAGERASGLREQDLPGHLAGDDEAADGFAKGEALPGEAPIQAGLVELKKLMAR